MLFKRIHHVAIICSNYETSKDFYVNKLGFSIMNEVFRNDRGSYKLDLAINGHYQIELFSFPNPPDRQTKPEAAGLRHLAFEVDSVEQTKKELEQRGIECEDIRVDLITNKKFTFFRDPDNLPLEIYEV
ncbi:VOC family protein [Margalitia sp. FSL K6-0131]|uniref:SMU1112c/YaeR family gloxylase I-like metalloprotein n=1 Tax=Margalitia sp. FSL K6-0131 TaxID=2954604 RepID=UPI0030F949AB